jgi:hypothetical protein
MVQGKRKKESLLNLEDMRIRPRRIITRKWLRESGAFFWSSNESQERSPGDHKSDHQVAKEYIRSGSWFL